MKKLIRTGGKRMLAAALTLILVMGVFLCVPFTAAAAGSYVAVTPAQRQAIADYALDTVLNPAMKRSLSLSGGDCTSFTANCLLAGGIEFDTDSPGSKWYWYSESQRSHWTSVPDMLSYLQAHEGMTGTGLAMQRLYAGSYTGINVSVLPGDIIGFVGEHMAVVVGGGSSASTIVTANHSRNTLMRLDWWTESYSPIPQIVIYRIQGYYTKNITGGQTSISPAPYERGSIYLQTDERVSMTLDTGISGNFSSGIPKVIAVQTYQDLNNPNGVGYCTDFNRFYNAEGQMNSSGTVTDPKAVKALSYGYHTKTESASDVNARLGLSGGNALQNVSEAKYVTQFGIWYALGQIQRSGSTLTYGSHTISIMSNSPYANARSFFGVAPSVSDPAITAASSRVHNAILRLIDIINDSGIPAPPTTPPALTLTPPSPNKCVYNASQDAFFAGPYTVTSTGSAAQFTVSLIGNSVGAFVVSTRYGAQTNFNWGSQFYVKIPKTAGISNLTVQVSAQFAIAPRLERFTPVSSSSLQGAIMSEPITEHDNARADQNLRIETFGKISVHKVTDKGENLAGVIFGVYSDAACTTLVKDPVTGQDVILVTNSAGNATSPDLLPYTVYVRETDMTEDQHLVLNMNPTVYQLTVQAGVTTPINANAGTVVNDYKTITIQIQKENARPDMMTYPLSGAVFEIRNITTEQKWSVTTDDSGFASQSNIPLGMIEVEEKTAPYGFEVNSAVQCYDLRKGEKGVDVIVQRCVFPEYPQTAKIRITKYDAETGTRPQGDASLTNARFSILANEDIRYLDGTLKYAKDSVIQTLECGANDTSATSMELPVGFGYYVREDRPPVGMTLLGRTIDISLDYQGQEVREYLYDASVQNIVIKGQIEIYKLMEGDPGNETTLNGENGAQFQVWLKSAGSYNTALPTERDFLTTRANPANGLNGWTKTKLLPYGLYVVHQLQPENGTEPIPDFEVFMDTNLKTYPFYKWNGPVIAFIQMAKRDSETKEIIPLANAAFKLWDYGKNGWYSIRTAYPSPVVHDTFYTDSTGTFTLPEPLRYGQYRWVEVSAPYGYVNPAAADPGYKGLDFAVDENMQVIDGSYMVKNNIPVFLFDHYDMPQKARIGVDKYGDQFSGITVTQSDFGSVQTPVFTRQRLAGCQFILRAKADIITPDGTKRYSAGQVVDTLMTSASETVYSKLLYLGDYEVFEASTVSGFVQNPEVRDVSLAYRGEWIVAYDDTLTFENERGRVSLTLEKRMAALPGSGEKPFDKVRYGLYADQDFTDYPGNVRIHKGALMEVLSLDSAGKYASQKAMLWGAYTVRELTTSEMHQLDANVYPLHISPDNPARPVKTVPIAGPDGKPLTNDLIKGTIRIDKTGLQFVGSEKSETGFGTLYTPVFEDRPLEGAEFDVIAKEDIFSADGTKVVSAGEVVDRLITGLNGKAESKPLYLGRYACVETKAPGMVLDDTEHEVTLDETNLHEDVVWTRLFLSNARQKVSVELQKQMELPAGADSDYNPFADVKFGLFAGNDMLVDGETVIPADGLAAVIEVDSDGKGLLKGYLPCGDFYLLELRTSPLHRLNTTRFDVPAQYQGQETDTVHIKVNEGNPIVNELNRAKIKVIKTDGETQTLLEGVVFTVIDPNGNAVCEIITGADGTAETGWLPVSGKPYTVAEKSTLTEYVLDDTPVEIILTEHERIYELELENVKIRGRVRIFKYTDNKTPVQGAVFGIYGGEGELIEQITSGEDGYAVSDDLIYGKYTIVELSAARGFVLDQTPFELEITVNNKTCELSFRNERIPDSPAIPKTGDTSDPGLWLLLGGAACCVLVLTLAFRRRKK